MNTGTVTQITVPMVKNPGGEPQRQEPSAKEQLVIANTPDEMLSAIAKHEAYKDYQESPTRTVTNVVGHSIPFVDSFMRGAMNQGPGSAKVSQTASTGTDWGIFAGAVWMFNKAVDKVYEKFPAAREFKEDHPVAAYVGELGSAVLVGQGAIAGSRKLGLQDKVSKGVQRFIEKRPKLEEAAGKVYNPVSKFAEKHPVITRYAGLGAIVTLVGLIAKNIYDVHNADKKADERLAELKDERYQVTRDMLNNAVMNNSVQG